MEPLTGERLSAGTRPGWAGQCEMGMEALTGERLSAGTRPEGPATWGAPLEAPGPPEEAAEDAGAGGLDVG
jgi:hypothetical protein